MRKLRFALAASIAIVALPALSAHATTYFSKLEYQDGGDNVGVVGPISPDFGVVKIEEIDAQTVKVTVTLTDPNSVFINTGNLPDKENHNPFAFSLTSDLGVDVATPGFSKYPSFGDTLSNSVSKQGNFWSTPFGDFTDRISCCGDNKGQVNGLQDPLVFTVTNAAGVTFGGLGAKVVGGKLTDLGTGEHFLSNADGWWFAADIYDGATGKTYNVAARDALTGVVPEPATWALMIMGFGGAGALLRRRRTALA